MRFGIDVPNAGLGGDPRILVELALEAEAARWDAFFIWDSLQVASQDARVRPTVDPWITLAAIAQATRRIKLGTMVTPPARRRPWKLAREAVSLDWLSGGRLVLPVGLGEPNDGGFRATGEPTDRRTRAERLDESLQILELLWSGRPVHFSGKHYTVDGLWFEPAALQSPRIPVWVVAGWPRERSMRRAARLDGVIAFKMGPAGSLADSGRAFAGGLAPDDVHDLCAWVERHRQGGTPFDVVLSGGTGRNEKRRAERVRPYAEAGATWWIESAAWLAMWSAPGDVAAVRERIRLGPPALL